MSTPTKNFSLVHLAGNTEDGKFFVEIKYKNGNLSLTGVAGPKMNGDAKGSCGQCYEYLLEIGTETALKIHDIWVKHHLNDMRPYCEHQVAIHKWNPRLPITMYHFKQTSETLTSSYDLKKAKEKELLKNGTTSITKEERELLNLPYTYTSASPDPKEGYELDRTENKTAGWVRPEEHPDGLLGKPCPTCDYQYGTAWKKEPVPVEVLEFLASLKDDSGTYPWRDY